MTKRDLRMTVPKNSGWEERSEKNVTLSTSMGTGSYCRIHIGRQKITACSQTACVQHGKAAVPSQLTSRTKCLQPDQETVTVTLHKRGAACSLHRVLPPPCCTHAHSQDSRSLPGLASALCMHAAAQCKCPSTNAAANWTYVHHPN